MAAYQKKKITIGAPVLLGTDGRSDDGGGS